MTPDKDIRYIEKKVDESWKDQVARDKFGSAPAASTAASKQTPQSSSPAFLNLLNSLAYQAMFHMGTLQSPEAPAEVNLEAAKETIDLLIALKQKTRGNCSAEEETFLESAVAELQLKFTQLA